MTNGSMLNELREILKSETPLPARIANRMVLSAITEIMEAQQKTMEENKKLFQLLIEKQEKLSNNLAVKAGDYISSHPKTSILWLVLLFILSNVLYVPALRTPILKLLGVPDDITNMLP